MTARSLTVIKTEPVSTADRIRDLQEQAKRLAADETHFFVGQITALQLQAERILEGGNAYEPGVRDIARKIARDCEQHALVIQSLVGRNFG